MGNMWLIETLRRDVANLNPGWVDQYLFALSFSFIISLLLTLLLIVVLRRLNLVDRPDPRKIHTTPVPRMGGLAIFAGFAIPMILLMYYDTPQKGIVYGSFVALLIGAGDDLFGIPASIKLVVIFFLTLLIANYGVITSLPFHLIGIDDQIPNIIVTMIWLTGVTSAMNALDHMDGLAGGVSIIAAIAYLCVSLQTGQYFWGLMAVSLCGSVMGFLVFNLHPAKIFMGDCGSFFLGFCLASLGIMGGWSTNPLKSSIIPVAILSVPIFDLTFVILARRISGVTNTLKESIVYCGKDHIGHRFCDLGFSQLNAVRVIYLIAATIAISALSIRHVGIIESALLLAQIVMVYVIILILMRKVALGKMAALGNK